jgi:uncharacterized damage-inducible protein DinB
MQTIKHIVKHLREFYNGGNWTASNLKSQLKDITWQEAITEVYGFNTIAILVFHINYYVQATSKVLQGNPLDANDKYAFDCPPINSKEDWEQFKTDIFKDAENFSQLLEKLPEHTLWADIADPKYGDYYRNIQGIIEHNHYHLGQIVLLKRIIKSRKK